MNLKLISSALFVLLVPSVATILLFAAVNVIQSSMIGYSVLDLLKFSEYVVVPIIYFVYIFMLIFKNKMELDLKTALIILIFGLILIEIVFIILKKFFVPTLSEVSNSFVAGGRFTFEYDELLRNTMLIGVFYLSYVFSAFLSQLSNSKKLFKILIFVFGGLILFFAFSSLEIFIYNQLA